jgi:NarL family two-component system response regulator LiaR
MGTPQEVLEMESQIGVDRTRFRTIIISDFRLVSDAVTDALLRHAAISVVGCFVNVTAMLAHLDELRPDCVLIDTTGLDGPSSVICLRDVAPQVKVIAVGVSEATDVIIAWVEAGAVGYISKTVALSALGPLLAGILHGCPACSAKVTERLMRRLSEIAHSARNRSDSVDAFLTWREKQIMELLCAGFSNKQIAHELSIGLGTAKTHVHHLLNKLRVDRRSQIFPLLQGKLPRPSCSLMTPPVDHPYSLNGSTSGSNAEQHRPRGG